MSLMVPMKTKAIPVAEIFGPTIQGEGPLAGVSTTFVRFGGCDYLCSWCDSLHAVLPQHVRQLERLPAAEIVARLRALDGASRWVTLSGGNPAMHQLDALVDQLHAEGWYVAVETQGSRWQPWLAKVDQLVISPKPPSSGMLTTDHELETARFDGREMGTRHESGDASPTFVVEFTTQREATQFGKLLATLCREWELDETAALTRALKQAVQSR